MKNYIVKTFTDTYIDKVVTDYCNKMSKKGYDIEIKFSSNISTQHCQISVMVICTKNEK